MEEELKQKFTRDQVMDVIFYCFFDMERALSRAFRAKLQHKKFFEEMFLKEQEQKNKMKRETRRRMAKVGREAMMMNLAGNDPTSYNLGQFIESVRDHMKRSKEVNTLADELGLNNQSRQLITK